MKEIIKTETEVKYRKVYQTIDGQVWRNFEDAYLHEEILNCRKVKCPECDGSGTHSEFIETIPKSPGDVPGSRESYRMAQLTTCKNCAGSKWVPVNQGIIDLNKAHNETKKDEEIEKLNAELERKNREISEFQETFNELAVQVKEMQLFNAKLAFANKLFLSNRFPFDDKIRIAEEFDNTGSIEEAKELYKKYNGVIGDKCNLF